MIGPKRRLASGAAMPSSTISAMSTHAAEERSGRPAEDRRDRARLHFRARHLARGGGRVDVLQRRRRGADDDDLVVEEAGRQAPQVDASRRTRAGTCFRVRSSRSRRALRRTRWRGPDAAVGHFGARDRERLQPADRVGDAPQRRRPDRSAAAPLAGREPTSASSALPSLPRKRDLAVPLRFRSWSSRCAHARCATLRAGLSSSLVPVAHWPGGGWLAAGGQRAGAGLAELHVVGDHLRALARDVFDHARVHAARERPLQARVRRTSFRRSRRARCSSAAAAAADREARVDGAQLERAQQVGGVGEDPRPVAPIATIASSDQAQPPRRAPAWLATCAVASPVHPDRRRKRYPSPPADDRRSLCGDCAPGELASYR